MQIIDNISNENNNSLSQKSRLQRICFDRLEKSPLPNRKHESWRLSSKSKLNRFLDYSHSKEFHQPNIPEGLLRGETINIIIGQNKPISIEKKNWKIRELSEIEIYDLINEKLKQSDSNDNWSNLLNQYLSDRNNILGLNIAGKNIPRLELLCNSQNNFLNAKTLFLTVEKDTQIEILQINLGDTNSSLSSSSYLFLGENSSISHGMISYGEKQSNLINSLNVIQENESSYNLGSLQFGFDFARFEINVNQVKGNAKTNIKGMQISKNNEELSTYAKIEFNGPNGYLDQLNKSLARDRSHSIFEGLIVVPQIAQKTDASQLSRNLLLSNYAKIDTKPQLEIIADDVKCKHGATISQLNENELFYMRSRGLTLEQASKLQLRSYYQEVIDFIPISESKWDILDMLLKFQ